MPENKPFVVNDRRKFTAEGDVRPDAPPSEPKPPRPEAALPPEVESSARLIETRQPEAEQPQESVPGQADGEMPPPPTTEQSDQATRAYDATVDRLDTAIRATNPGMERIPEMTFERLVQSVYMQAIMQLGGGAEPGQTPQVDLLGARQSIDMLAVMSDKAKGNLTDAEDKLLQSALFEMRMGFLEVTQALARQAQSRQGAAPAAAAPPSGPSLVR